jgi:uncharacterized membrane protein YbhN (UPF0104 family)/tRNA A-37 threonylcarbamoyl transferase component Bud32
VPSIIDEPAAPARIRRQPDLIRALLNFAGIVALVLFGVIANGTTVGLASDLTRGGAYAPKFLISLVTAVSSSAIAVVPLGLALERLMRRDGRRVADGVIAATLAYLGGLGLNMLIIHAMPADVKAVLTRSVNHGLSSPFHLYVASVVAFVTIVGFGNRHAVQVFAWSVLVADSVATLINGETTLVAMTSTFLLARAVAFGWRFTRGAINVRPSGRDLVAALTTAGLRPVSCRYIGSPDEARRYEVVSATRGTLEVTLLDRDQRAIGLSHRLYRRVRLRGPAQRRNLVGLRRAVEQEALMAYAVRAAGIRAPELVAVRDLGPDTALIAYQQVRGRSVAELAEDELTDALLGDIWRTLVELQQHQLAHRQLSPERLLVDDDGQLWLTHLQIGEIAATDLQLSLDTAELLASLSVLFGAERTVRVASEVLGSETVAGTLPMLQPVALTGTTRAALRRAGNVLHQVREQILAFNPTVETEPVRLERLRPRTLLVVVAMSVALYALLSQLRHVAIDQLVGSMSWGWALAAVAASALTYVGAAMSLGGFVPEKLPPVRLLLSQVAASVVSVVTPSAVGGATVNARFLQKAGVQPGLAVTSVGASQLAGMVIHILLLMLFGFISGTQHGLDLPPSTTLIAILLSFAVLILVVAAINPLRRYALGKLRPFFSGVVPRMLDLAQDPAKLATGIGGATLLSLMYISCLWASIQAFGGHSGVTFANVAVIFLAGQAVGSAVPTPGGIGTVDAALTLGVSGLRIPYATAVLAVFLFRLVTLWLPVIPGWAAFSWMHRNDAL